MDDASRMDVLQMTEKNINDIIIFYSRGGKMHVADKTQ